MQAQDYLGALWAIGLRLPGATEIDVEHALANRSIIRTWSMRGTLHFVAAADVRWMLELLTPRIIARAARRYQQLELNDMAFGHARDLFISALQGGKQLSRPAMYALLDAAGISTAGQRGTHILGRLAQEGLICFCTREGKQHTFALLNEWVPATKRLERDGALAELTTRYFTGHGPATLQDFVWWSGLNVSDARGGLEMAASLLVQETVNGTLYWGPPNQPLARAASPAVYLLPGFDEYMLGYRDRGASLDPLYTNRINPGGNGMFSPTIVVDGRVMGTWKRTLKKNTTVITASPFTPLSAPETHGLATAAEKYCTFLTAPVSLQIE